MEEGAISGRQVRMARAALRMSVEQLAELAGVGVATIGRVEADRPSDSQFSTLHRIRSALEAAGAIFSQPEADVEGVSVPREWAFAGMLHGRAIHRPVAGSTPASVDRILEALNWPDIEEVLFFTIPLTWRHRVASNYWCNTSVLVVGRDRYFISDLCPLIYLPGHPARPHEVERVVAAAQEKELPAWVLEEPLTVDTSKKKASTAVAEVLGLAGVPLSTVHQLEAAVWALKRSC